MTTIQKGVLTCAIALAAVLMPWGLRLVPETSPVERGAAAANSYDCIDCHGRPEPGFPDDVDLSCTNIRANSSHPDYEGRCSDVLAYFEVVRLKRTFPARLESANRNRLLQGKALRASTIAFNATVSWVRVAFETRARSKAIYRVILARTSRC